MMTSFLDNYLAMGGHGFSPSHRPSQSTWKDHETKRESSLIRLQHRQKRLLRDLHLAHLFHALFAGGLLGPQLALAGDVAAVALGGDVLAHGGDGLAGDDAAADGGLNGDLEHVAVDFAAQLLHQLAAAAVGE